MGKFLENRGAPSLGDIKVFGAQKKYPERIIQAYGLAITLLKALSDSFMLIAFPSYQTQITAVNNG